MTRVYFNRRFITKERNQEMNGQTPPKAPPKSPLPSAPDILAAGAQHMRDRAATYDKPEGERSMAQTVKVFNAFHGTNITEAQGWHFMQILKDVRLFTSPIYHADSAEDGVAYAGLKAEAMASDMRDEPQP